MHHYNYIIHTSDGSSRSVAVDFSGELVAVGEIGCEVEGTIGRTDTGISLAHEPLVAQRKSLTASVGTKFVFVYMYVCSYSGSKTTCNQGPYVN